VALIRPLSDSREVRVHPSLSGEVRKFGKFGEVCYSCGTCTLTCDLTTDATPFPRRPVQFAVLGLKEPLLESLEPWLCHDCGDCSEKCPQQAGPRESMATLRRYLTAQYDWTGLSAKIFKSRGWAIGAPAFAGFLVVLLAAVYHILYAGMPFSEIVSTSMGLEHMFGKITWFTLAVIFLPLAVLLSNAARMYRLTMGRGQAAGIPLSVYLSEAGAALRYAFTQDRIAKCPGESFKSRRVKHSALYAGGLLMFVLLAFFLRFFQTDAIHPFYHPQRWLGYIATAFLVYGSADILAGRIRKKEEIHKHSEFCDYSLPVLILLSAATGITVHIFRYSGLAFAAHYAYLVHLVVSVPILVVELPFGKLSHMAYRPLAVYLQAVKDKAISQQIVEEKREAA
jgi:ferredoxin